MARELYIRNTKEKPSRLRTILVTCLIVVLLASSVVMLVLARKQQTAQQAEANFQAALVDQDYATALEIYRDVQSQAILPAEAESRANPYQASLTAMESTLNQRLEQIEQVLLAGQMIQADDRAFVIGLGELSGLRMSRFARDLCRSYLMGEVPYADLSRAIDQLSDLGNLRDSVAPLAMEYQTWPQLQPAIQAADLALQTEQWYVAYAAWEQMAQIADEGSFIQDFTRQKLEACKTAMYQPLLADALDVLAQNRVVTAQGHLQALAAVFPGDETIQTALDQCEDRLPKKLATFRGAIEHLVIKPLINRPEVAFDADPYAAAAFDTLLTTVEFQRLLEQLYQNNYILVDQSRLMTEAGETFALALPEGKKPLVLVLDGLNYFATRRETGNCWDLQLDAQGQVCGVVPGPDGQMVLDREAEAIGILDRFVEEHPDFSYDGAKGLITFSGFEGILGLVTDPDQLDDKNQALSVLGYPALDLGPSDYEANRQQVMAVLAQLKRTGWQFGTSTYGMINLQSATLEQVQADWQKWQTQIEPLVGPVAALSFPNGAVLQADDPRREFLQAQGIRVFSGLGATPYIVRSGNTVYADKVQLGGYSLTHPVMFRLERFFDASLVIDQEARSLVND